MNNKILRTSTSLALMMSLSVPAPGLAQEVTIPCGPEVEAPCLQDDGTVLTKKQAKKARAAEKKAAKAAAQGNAADTAGDEAATDTDADAETDADAADEASTAAET
ncbi:MAG: hypothetical protein WBN04_10470, partial [Paracoccaceae bacterium]